ncbi:hypothetical protein FQZ97_1226470 [compost metagenome]
MPTMRACTAASHATHSASRPPTSRNPRGIRGQPGTATRSSAAPPSTQAALARDHMRNRRCSSSPSHHDSPHSATISAPRNSDMPCP